MPSIVVTRSPLRNAVRGALVERQRDCGVARIAADDLGVHGRKVALPLRLACLCAEAVVLLDGELCVAHQLLILAELLFFSSSFSAFSSSNSVK